MHKIMILVIGLFIATAYANDCIPLKFASDSVVCVCNATYCDSTPQTVLKDGNFEWYVSSKEGHRLSYFSGKYNPESWSENENLLIVDSKKTFQTIRAWGGAFTDAAGINIKKLSPEVQNVLIQTYFGQDGSRYTIGRVPIGGCDFSTRPYTYDDHPDDVELQYFSLAPEDIDYKIPLMKLAQQINPDVKFLGVAWTAPPWMKTNNNYYGFGVLKDEYYQTWANYYQKFFEAYDQHGIRFWAISTGNEPINAFFPVIPKLSSTGWLPESVGKWIVQNLGPTLANSTYNETLILVLDDQRFLLPSFVDNIFIEYPEADKYVDGIAVHWYWDQYVLPNVLDETNENHPNKFLLLTESCVGVSTKPSVELGSWKRAEQLIKYMIQNLNHWITGWIDWNLALDETGGPNWINNTVDASIIVNPSTNEFYKQPLYYVMKHFSRFVPPGSVKIEVSSTENIDSTAFKTPIGEVVVVFHNKKNRMENVKIKDVDYTEATIKLQLPPSSLNTVIYKPTVKCNTK